MLDFKDFREYLLTTQFLMIISDISTRKRLIVGFHKARLMALCFFFFKSMICPKIATKNDNIILFADDTSIIVTNSIDTNLKIVMN